MNGYIEESGIYTEMNDDSVGNTDHHFQFTKQVLQPKANRNSSSTHAYGCAGTAEIAL